MGLQDGQMGLGGVPVGNRVDAPVCDICGEPATGSGGVEYASLLTCDECDAVVARQRKADDIERAIDVYPGLRDRHAMKGRAK